MIEWATAVVDTGREYDPARLRYDHHQFPGAESSAASAAMLVYRHLNDDGMLAYLEPLVQLISAGDTGAKTHGADWSREIGIHALLSAKKARKATDAELLAFGYEMLDLLAERLQSRALARDCMGDHVVYQSDDGLFVALYDAPQATTYAAFEEGARVVLFCSPSEATVAIGLQRAVEWQEPHCGDLVADAQENAGILLRDELATWFRHNAGFFAGRGTAKAPDQRPLAVPLRTLAEALDAAWKR